MIANPVPGLMHDLFGKLVADRGYISNKLDKQLKALFDLQLITKLQSNMKNQLLSISDKLLLSKRAFIETIIDQLKNIAETDGTGRLLIPSSKTDQTGQGPLSSSARRQWTPLMPTASSPALSPGHCFAGFAGGIISPRAACLHTGLGWPYRPAPRLLVLRGPVATVSGLERLRIRPRLGMDWPSCKTRVAGNHRICQVDTQGGKPLGEGPSLASENPPEIEGRLRRSSRRGQGRVESVTWRGSFWQISTD